MLFLRSFIFTLGMWIFTPLFMTSALLVAPLQAHARYKYISNWAKIMLWWLRVTCRITHRVIGVENIPDHPSIILSKHQSAWETLAFQTIFPPQVWVLKRELLWVPFFGWGLALTSPIAIDRSAGREALKQLVALGKDRLKRGFWVVIFPEGTRVAPNMTSKFHIGGAWLASHAEATVVPVAHNAGEFWGKNSFIKRPGVITTSIGQAINCTGMKPDAINKQIEAWINAEMLQIKQYS